MLDQKLKAHQEAWRLTFIVEPEAFRAQIVPFYEDCLVPNWNCLFLHNKLI